MSSVVLCPKEIKLTSLDSWISHKYIIDNLCSMHWIWVIELGWVKTEFHFLSNRDEFLYPLTLFRYQLFLFRYQQLTLFCKTIRTSPAGPACCSESSSLRGRSEDHAWRWNRILFLNQTKMHYSRTVLRQSLYKRRHQSKTMFLYLQKSLTPQLFQIFF